MALSNFDNKIRKVVQATHHQGDIRYGMLRGIQCSCMSLTSVCWALSKSASTWDSFERKKKISLKKNYQGPEKKMQGAKERYYRDPESRR